MRFVAKNTITGLFKDDILGGQLVEAPLHRVAEMVAREYGGHCPDPNVAALLPLTRDGRPAPPPHAFVALLRRRLAPAMRRLAKARQS